MHERESMREAVWGGGGHQETNEVRKESREGGWTTLDRKMP